MNFHETVINVQNSPLMAVDIETLQVNLGYRCNLSCAHCHVDAGPHRAEMMNKETVDSVIDVLRYNPIETVDITGGSPELNPNFKKLISDAAKMNKHIICRTNLSIIFEHDMRAIPEFYKDHKVELTASLPCYLAENVDRMRGNGTFEKSIEALKILNKLGYGIDTDLKLNLVYNPIGDFIAPSEQSLEGAYKRELGNRFGISFTRLYAFTNMPVGRFRDALMHSDSLENYIEKLSDTFNPHTLEGLMCRRLINVGWDGRLFDCDFNQMLNMPALETVPHIRDFDYEALSQRKIAVDSHCYGCTAGHGFTCMGAVAASKS
jgi:radical SAM/Cys-rich protein